MQRHPFVGQLHRHIGIGRDAQLVRLEVDVIRLDDKGFTRPFLSGSLLFPARGGGGSCCFWRGRSRIDHGLVRDQQAVFDRFENRLDNGGRALR